MDWRWIIATVVSIGFFLWWSNRWQNRVNELMGVCMDLALKYGVEETGDDGVDRALKYYRRSRLEAVARQER